LNCAMQRKNILLVAGLVVLTILLLTMLGGDNTKSNVSDNKKPPNNTPPNYTPPIKGEILDEEEEEGEDLDEDPYNLVETFPNPNKFQVRPTCEDRLSRLASITPLVKIDWTKWTTPADLDNPRQQAFIKIYEDYVWGGGLGSGPGSALTYTVPIRCYLHNLILAFEITTIIDAPCGDLWWMSNFLKEHPDTSYIGIDIVPAVINHHKHVYNNSNWEFYVGDLTDAKLFPSVKAKSKVWKGNTMIMTRHAIEHNTLKDQVIILKNIHASGASHFFGTTHVDTHVQEITNVAGGFSKANFRLAPHNLPSPLEYLYEKSAVVYMGFWTLPFSNWKPDSVQ